MKLLIIFSIFYLNCFSNFVLAQTPAEVPNTLHVIKLNMDNKNFVDKLRIDATPGDSIQFESTGGDFAIYIINAISFLAIEDQDLDVRVNSRDPKIVKSPVYIVQSPTVDEPVYFYSVYCITNNSWPDAPPRIIIVVK